MWNCSQLSPREFALFVIPDSPLWPQLGQHSNKTGNARGGLKLDTKQLMRLGGNTGPSIVPGNLEKSWLYNAITHQDFVMPPKRKLPANVIRDFREWIEMAISPTHQVPVLPRVAHVHLCP